MDLSEILLEAMQRQDNKAESLNYNDLTQKYILQLGQNHPQFFQAIEHWRHGNITWEQATYAIIIALAKANVSTSEAYLKVLERSALPIFVGNSESQNLEVEPIKLDDESQFFRKAIDFCDDELRRQGMSSLTLDSNDNKQH
ncbi:hypothetical protein [Nostoc sp.]|uniref:hypothetical protein n=1 Tax=Nostoc sp. TaxID=1180 RepID=UPI002FFA8AC4